MIDPEAQQRLTQMKGEEGAEIQFKLIDARSTEIIDRAFDLVRIVSGNGAAVLPGKQPLIFQP